MRTFHLWVWKCLLRLLWVLWTHFFFITNTYFHVIPWSLKIREMSLSVRKLFKTLNLKHMWGYGVQFLFTQGRMKFSCLKHIENFFSLCFWGYLMNRITSLPCEPFPATTKENVSERRKSKKRKWNRERGEGPKIQV